MHGDDAAIERMKNYKGGPLPAPIVPISGLALGLIVPWGIKLVLDLPSKSGIDGLLTLLGYAPAVSSLFFAEFLLGAAARGRSTRASFSPAVAAASNQMPISLVESNRIHQNHIENLCIFAPLALATSIKDSSWAVACMLGWTMSRFLYRLGYTYQENPFWRICGVSFSQTQNIICAYVCFAGSVST